MPASLLPSPFSPPSLSAAGRGAISFRAGARGPRPRTRAQPQKAAGGDRPGCGVGPSRSGCDGGGDSFCAVRDVSSRPSTR